jgi:hypothetical protein
VRIPFFFTEAISNSTTGSSKFNLCAFSRCTIYESCRNIHCRTAEITPEEWTGPHMVSMYPEKIVMSAYPSASNPLLIDGLRLTTSSALHSMHTVTASSIHTRRRGKVQSPDLRQEVMDLEFRMF